MRVGRLTILFFVCALVPCLATADSNTDRAIAWLNTHQNTNGSWGTIPDLSPRDTARVLLAMQRVRSISTAMPAGDPRFGAAYMIALLRVVQITIVPWIIDDAISDSFWAE